jgi:hypothetical protein
MIDMVDLKKDSRLHPARLRDHRVPRGSRYCWRLHDIAPWIGAHDEAWIAPLAFTLFNALLRLVKFASTSRTGQTWRQRSKNDNVGEQDSEKSHVKKNGKWKEGKWKKWKGKAGDESWGIKKVWWTSSIMVVVKCKRDSIQITPMNPPHYILFASNSASSTSLGHPAIQYHYADDSPLSLLPKYPDEHVLLLDYDPNSASSPSVVSTSRDMAVTAVRVQEAPGAAAGEEKHNDRMYIIETISNPVEIKLVSRLL